MTDRLGGVKRYLTEPEGNQGVNFLTFLISAATIILCPSGQAGAHEEKAVERESGVTREPVAVGIGKRQRRDQPPRCGEDFRRSRQRRLWIVAGSKLQPAQSRW